MAPCSHAPCAHLPSHLALHRRSVRPEAAFGKFRDARQQPETRKPCPFHAAQQSNRRRRVLAAETGQLGAADLPPEEPEQPNFSVQVFSRIREKDPYRLLGVDQAATFEEVQDARNYLYEEFRGHGRSREAIEMAFDEILKHKMKFRHRYGFQPPKSGRRTDVQGEPMRKNLWEKAVALIDTSVQTPTVINDGVVFLALNIWAIWTSSALLDPTVPFGASFVFAVYRLNKKRKLRNPDGPYLGNNAVFGATITAAIAFAVSAPVAWLAVNAVGNVAGLGAGLTIVNIALAAATIYLK